MQLKKNINYIRMKISNWQEIYPQARKAWGIFIFRMDSFGLKS